MSAVRLCCISLLALLIAGCASAPAKQPIEPNLSLLAPANKALAKARAAHAQQFAPLVLDAARRRLALARSIIYMAARQGRELTDEERERVTDLVKAARLDARLALVKTQARAVGKKLEMLQLSPGNSATATSGGAR